MVLPASCNLNPKASGGAQKELFARGKEIYEVGILEKNVSACSSCHANEAKGNGPFPCLVGQLFDCISTKQTDWDKERGQDSGDLDGSTSMQPIARNLTDAQIKVVTVYLSELE